MIYKFIAFSLDFMLRKLAQFPLILRKPLLIAFDVLAIWLSGSISLNKTLEQESLNLFFRVFAPTSFGLDASMVIISLLVVVMLALFRVYETSVNTFSIELFVKLSASLLTSLIIIYSIQAVISEVHTIGNWWYFYLNAFLLLLGARALIWYAHSIAPSKTKRRVAVYGSGKAGILTVRALRQNDNVKICMLIDDNPDLFGEIIEGLKIENLDAAKKRFKAVGIDTVVLAIPSADSEQAIDIFSKLIKYPIEIKTIPELSNLSVSLDRISEISPITISNLLSRSPAKPDVELMQQPVFGKTVLVTGAGGSIGSEICRQVITMEPKKLILLDVSEAAVYTLLEELTRGKNTRSEISYQIGSVGDKNFLKLVFSKNNIHTVFHAAAYKHVPLMEKNIISAFNNNVLGTAYLVDACIDAEVETFSLVSSDKAVKPTNIMGASKRLAELYCLSANKPSTRTTLSIVRFGNVLGSSGSVVPLFEKQLKNGGPITVTHPDVTRYFMTISEASQLVIQSAGLAQKGQVFVLDMGAPVKIIDIARKIVNIYGFQYYLEGESPINNGIEIKIMGLRPGEKMYEELSHSLTLTPTKLKKVFVASSEKVPSKDGKKIVKEIENSVLTLNEKKVIMLAKELAEFKPNQQ